MGETTATLDRLNKTVIDNLMADLKARSDRLTRDDFKSETKSLYLSGMPGASVRTAAYNDREVYVTQVWMHGKVVLKDEFTEQSLLEAGVQVSDVHEEYVEIVESGEIDLYVGGSG
jgi:hypothetical protein